MACAHAILVLIAYAQNPNLNVHAEMLSGSRDQDQNVVRTFIYIHYVCIRVAKASWRRAIEIRVHSTQKTPAVKFLELFFAITFLSSILAYCVQ